MSRPAASLAVHDIGELVTLTPGGDALGLVHRALVLIDEGRIVYAGPQAPVPERTWPPQRLDAGGRLVTPGLVEPHAHPIFAGSRAAEFDLRCQGRSYLELQQAGGGILATVGATRRASDEELLAATGRRLDRLLAHGVTTCEAKTGYCLDVDGELRLLGLLVALRDLHPIDLAPTLLAHVPPPDQDRATFLRAFVTRAIPEAARSGAEAVDVYCDAGAFTVEESRRILEVGAAHGLALRVHAEQFVHTGIAALAAGLGARSVEHLEQLEEAEIPALARAGTVCNLLPGAALTLRLPWPDARRLLDRGCAVALGTDLNPGSSLTESLPLMMSLACTQMGLSVAEAWRAVTVVAAQAVGRHDAGILVPGARGDLVLWDGEDHREVPQHLGVNLVSQVVIGGAVVHGASDGVRRLA